MAAKTLHGSKPGSFGMKSGSARAKAPLPGAVLLAGDRGSKPGMGSWIAYSIHHQGFSLYKT
jgi:hypothetical protein